MRQVLVLARRPLAQAIPVVSPRSEEEEMEYGFIQSTDAATPMKVLYDIEPFELLRNKIFAKCFAWLPNLAILL